jgi:sugar phosphate isomerase/epimerase
MSGMKKEMGVQTFTFRSFTIEQAIDASAELGLAAIELWPKHLPVESPPERLREVGSLLEGKGLRVAGVGVVGVTADRAKTISTLDYASALGADYLSISFDPADRETTSHLVAEAEKRGLLLAVHNHGPKDRFSEPEAVLRAVEGFPASLGACVDTGHYLRSGQAPDDCVRVLGGRVHAVHLKDFIDEETEVEPGTGRLSFPEFLAALAEHTDFRSAFVLEYEADPEDPLPSMRSAVERLAGALGKA